MLAAPYPQDDGTTKYWPTLAAARNAKGSTRFLVWEPSTVGYLKELEKQEAQQQKAAKRKKGKRATQPAANQEAKDEEEEEEQDDYNPDEPAAMWTEYSVTARDLRDRTYFYIKSSFIASLRLRLLNKEKK